MIDYEAMRKDQNDRVYWAHDNITPTPTDFVVVYEDHTGAVGVIHPSAEFMAMLRHGGLVRNMRRIADVDKRPLLRGSAELLPAMTEQEAIEFVAWKDVPMEVQVAHARGNRPRIVICHRSQLIERTFRNAWRMSDAG